MYSARKFFYILSAVSIALNFLFLTVVLHSRTALLETVPAETTDNAVISASFPPNTSVQISSDDSGSISEINNKKTYNKDLFLTELSQYRDIILPYTADKEENYLSEILFIGDSNTAGLASFGYMPLQNVLGKKSMGIQGVTSNSFVWLKGYSQPVTVVQAVKLLKPRRIIINFGTNNTIGTTPKEFKSMYLKALNAISRAYPYSDIIVAAVLPVGYYRENYSIKQETVDSFNIVLAEICSEHGYKFLDYTEVFKDKQNGYMLSDCVAYDGIHLNDKGYRLLLEYINDHQYITKDIRPDTKNIPRQIKAPSNETAAVTAEAENVPADSTDPEQMYDYVPPSDSAEDPAVSEKEQTSTTSEHLSDSSSDLDIINSEKIIYDPFL